MEPTSSSADPGTAPAADGGESQRLLTAAEVGGMLSVPTSWDYRAAREGELPCVACGRYRRFDRDDVWRWIEARKAAARAA